MIFGGQTELEGSCSSVVLGNNKDTSQPASQWLDGMLLGGGYSILDRHLQGNKQLHTTQVVSLLLVDKRKWAVVGGVKG